jgi:AraC-like DNA-binding protein
VDGRHKAGHDGSGTFLRPAPHAPIANHRRSAGRPLGAARQIALLAAPNGGTLVALQQREWGLSRPETAVMATWREQLWSTFVRLESASEDDDFYGRVEPCAPGSCRLSCVHSTAQLTERTNSHLRSDPQELVLLAVQKSGYGFVEQDGRQARLQQGDFAIYDTTRPYRLYFEKPFEQLIVRFPRHLLDRRLPGLPRLTARRYRGQRGPGAVATGFALHLAAAAPTLGDRGVESFEAGAADILATAIAFEHDGGADSDRVSFERIQSKMMRQVRVAGADFARLAAAEGMSLRSLQRLFQTQGTTPTKWMQDRRLEGVARDLRDSAQAARSITEIAFSWGFNDLSHFNRAFRARFALSPSGWRGTRPE